LTSQNTALSARTKELEKTCELQKSEVEELRANIHDLQRNLHDSRNKAEELEMKINQIEELRVRLFNRNTDFKKKLEDQDLLISELRKGRLDVDRENEDVFVAAINMQVIISPTINPKLISGEII
jgi:predicted RNase H-like nuclease (RuvC/YqgF family)